MAGHEGRRGKVVMGAGFADAAPEAVLAALFLPFAVGALQLPADGRVLFLGARAGSRVRELAQRGWLCEQSFAPFAAELSRCGLRVDEPAADETFPLVLLLARRQREVTRELLARALSHLAPGGTLLSCVANNAGAKSVEADLARLAGPTQRLSKHKCRVFWVTPAPAAVDHALRDAWLALETPRITAAGYWSRPGLFAWDRIDRGSTLLAEELPADLAGRVADLGAGYGYLGVQVLKRCPRVEVLHLYEAERRALDSARHNLRQALREAQAGGAGRVPSVDVRWHDVTLGLPETYDAIVSNPPFHQGRADLPQLGQAFIASAADALRADGRLLLVANRHLPYESLLRARFGEVHAVAERDGYKVISGQGPRP
jgi:16S rRNA (guanine1207-N2)-methyltransferase